MFDIPFVDSVFHPTDLSDASSHAFAHALAIALHRQSRFTILHATQDSENWMQFPSIQTTLRRWGLLSESSDGTSIFNKLDINVEKISLQSTHPLKAIIDYLKTKPSDLIVLATEGREGLARWIRPSIAERIAHQTETKTLFVPNKCRGFVSYDTGKVLLKKILIPVDFHPSPSSAIEYAARAAKYVGGKVEITLCHIGKDWKMSSLILPDHEDITWIKKNCTGNIVEKITEMAAAQEIDLLVMPTAGHDGVFDALRGSVTEKVLRHAPCPLLAVPTN